MMRVGNVTMIQRVFVTVAENDNNVDFPAEARK